MDPQQIEAACDLLLSNWQAGTVLDHLPYSLRPDGREAGYAVQAAILRHSAMPLKGWKIAATSRAGQAHINVDGPMAGRLLAERHIAPGGSTRLGANRMKVAEPEFAFCMARPLVPRTRTYSEAEAMAAVASLHPSIELPDSRYSRFVEVGAAQLIADNACAHRFMIGPAATADWRALDLSRHIVTGSLDGRRVAEGSGANVLGNPRIALTWLANELSALGLTLEAGQVVMTGTCMTPLPIEAGMVVSADFGVLGTISMAVE
jgi:2-keto-4-pentenoate hydratase